MKAKVLRGKGEGELRPSPYDELYKQVDMSVKPYGYSQDYLLWRTAKLKGPWSSFIRHNGKILDVGGGFAILTRFLPDFIDTRNYYDMDVSLEMLRYSPYNNFLGAGEAIPFRDATFDYVVSSDVLEHVNDKVQVLMECFRVLRPGGLFFLSTPRTGWTDDFRKSPFRIFMMIDAEWRRRFPRKPAFTMVPMGVKDEPSDEKWLRETLQYVGFKVTVQYRADNHVAWAKAGEGKLWRWFADRFVDPSKYGHCTCAICTK